MLATAEAGHASGVRRGSVMGLIGGTKAFLAAWDRCREDDLIAIFTRPL